MPNHKSCGGPATPGGAPYVEADRIERVQGLDVEIAELIAKELGRVPEFIQIAFTIARPVRRARRLRVGLGGIEELRPAARRSPSRSVLRVPRGPHRPHRRPRSVPFAGGSSRPPRSDARGTTAYDLLLDARARDGIVPVTYEDDVHPY